MTCFVILHYLVADETISTVDSILKNVNGEFKIIIVDNCSPNDSYEILKNRFENEEKVSVIKNNTNAGYAKGINYGYLFAKENFSPSFIVAMNNDMEICQPDFIDCIIRIFDETQFYVLGPDVYSTSAKKHQNPETDQIRTMNDLNEHVSSVQKIMNNKLKLKLKGLLRSSKFIYNLYYEKKRSENAKVFVKERKENVTLHGSCLIFSELFIKAREYALFPKTNFYCEAQILDYECIRDGMLQVYDPSLKVFHHEDVATDAVAGSYATKLINKCEKVLESLEVFRKLMSEEMKG